MQNTTPASLILCHRAIITPKDHTKIVLNIISRPPLVNKNVQVSNLRENS